MIPHFAINSCVQHIHLIGILITGPSGVGKTYLSKKFVEQLPGFQMINVHCADLIHKVSEIDG